MTREQQLKSVWKRTHSDYKGIAGERLGADAGKRTIMVLRNGATCLVLLDNLTDAEIANRLPKASA